MYSNEILQIISIQSDPYYQNKARNHIFTCDEYHAGKIIVMRIPTNLFGLPDEYKKEEHEEGDHKENIPVSYNFRIM